MAHDQPTYASVPGIRVFGMMCVKPTNFNGGAYRRPVVQPPKRNQQFQPQSPYYQRYKKHATVKPTSQSKGDASSQASDYSEFTTRGLGTVGPETREADDGIDLNESGGTTITVVDTTTSFDGSSSPTTVASTDASSIETTGSDESVNDRVKRMIDAMDAASDDNIATDKEDMENIGIDEFFTSNRRQRRSTDDLPDIPWDEVSQQIKQLNWD